MSHPLVSLLAALSAFIRCRHRASRLKTRADIDAHQKRQMQRWLKEDVPGVSAYSGLHATRLADLPVIDKAVLMDDFHQFNRLSLSAAEGWALFERKSAPDGFHVGASTGTSGNRGLYLISDRERAEWLGTILAKALPRFPFERARVAIILAQDAALYRQPGKGRLLALRFFDLNDGLAGLSEKLHAYRPDTIIAPPKVLRYLAGLPRAYPVKRLFSGAEVMDESDRHAISTGFGIEPAEIYMATEGLFGVSCKHGSLHLAEDVMHFEFEPGPDGSGLVNPVISDFSRRTQIMARYRMNDLLRLSPHACPCGSPLQVVEEVAGRADDMLEFPSVQQGNVVVTPDVIRNAILDANRDIRDFRAEQVDENHLLVVLPSGVPQQAADAVQMALQHLCSRLAIAPIITIEQRMLTPPLEKLRRVRRNLSQPR